MATLVIRNVENEVHARLKEIAASHGHSMEEEARDILRDRLAIDTSAGGYGLATAIRALFEPLGGLDLPEIPRDLPRDPPDVTSEEWNADTAR